MFRFPANKTHKPTVAVEYDCRGRRKLKSFASDYEALRFYAAKLKAGCNPRVCKGT